MIREDDCCAIRLDGAIDIASAAELKEALLAAVESGQVIRLSLEDVSDLDVTAVQLLWAARRDAEQRGVAFAVSTGPSASVRRTLAEVGLDSFVLAAGRTEGMG